MDAVAEVAGSSDAFAEEGSNKVYEAPLAKLSLLGKLALRLGVPPELIPVIMMSFGCFMDAISDVTFLLSLAFVAAPYVNFAGNHPCTVGVYDPSMVPENGHEDESYSPRNLWCDEDNYEDKGPGEFTGDYAYFCEDIIGAAKIFDAGSNSGDLSTSKVQIIARILLGAVLAKELFKILPFFHIYVSTHFHNPANFQSLHNSSITWVLLLFSKRWKVIAKDSLKFEKEAPAIIHILADVMIEDVPQLAFTIFLLIVGLRFPCFLANTDAAAWKDTLSPLDDLCGAITPPTLDDGTICFVFVPSSYKYSGPNILFRENGDIVTVDECSYSYQQTYSNDPSSLFQQCKTKYPDPEPWSLAEEIPDQMVDITYMNQCSSPFSSQSILPFCSCAGFGGGGIDGLMVFSLLMTIISTASKIWKLFSNIQKRHRNIEEAYENKASRGESGGISALELNELGGPGGHRRNPSAVSSSPPDARLEEVEALLANVQKQVKATRKECLERLTDLEEAQKASEGKFNERLNKIEAK
jgi:hypothetical protein